MKNEYLGEIHRFSGLTGTVDENGNTVIEIDLATLDTLFEIRDERMMEHVFNFAPSATISGRIDMTALDALEPGETMILPIEGTLSFPGEEILVTPDMFVARMGEDQVLVTTESMVFVATDELGIDPGIDMLMEIAGLDSITRGVPVTMRLMFRADGPES